MERNEDSLTVTGKALELRFKINPTVDTSKIIGSVWKLATLFIDDYEAVFSPAKAEAPILEFKPGRVFTASTGCREISGNYSFNNYILNGDELKISGMKVEGNCPPEQ